MSESASTSTTPVFLVGAARSGTSLLFRTTALHPDATWLSNWVQRFPRFPQLTVLNQVARTLSEERSKVWFGKSGDNAYVYGRKRPLRERLMPQPVEAETLYRHNGIPEVGGLVSADVDPAALDRLRHVFEVSARWDRRSVAITKRIANNRRIPMLLEVFPDAKFVEIVRDGRAVAYSLSKVDWWAESEVWWYGGNPANWKADGGDTWSLCARNWVEEVKAVREGMAQVPEGQGLSISYEDLVSDPQGTLGSVVSFAGLDASDPAYQRGLSAVKFPNKNDSWRSALSPEAMETIESVQREELVRYGYLPADAEVPSEADR